MPYAININRKCFNKTYYLLLIRICTKIFLQYYFHKRDMNMTKSGTSTPEQSIFYYIKQFFPDAQNRFHYKINNQYVEIDIYIPSIKVAIEYDGAIWHKNKADTDTQKTLLLNKDGLYVIRVRDVNCPEIPELYGKIFYHGKAPNGVHTNEYIELIVHEISKFCIDKNLADNLKSFKLTFEDYIKDSPNIISQLYPYAVANNKSQFCGAEYWDYEDNGHLKLENIPANDKSNIWVNYVCQAGHKIHSSISLLRNKNDCDTDCKKCYYSICPFIGLCESQCDVIENAVNSYLFGGELLGENLFKSILWRNYLSVTKYLIYFINQGIKNVSNSIYRNRFESFFITDSESVGKIYCNQSNVKITTLQDLSLIKEFYILYRAIVIINVVDLPETDENIEAIDNFLQWVLDFVDVKQCIVLGRRLFDSWQVRKISSNSMSIQFKNSIKKFIDKIEFNYSYKFRVSFD